MKPDFLVVGCQRCGTTWLYQQLVQHDEIFVPKDRKEVEYFDLNYDKGAYWYHSYFAGAEKSLE